MRDESRYDAKGDRMNRTKGVLIATAAATLILAGSVSTRADEPKKPDDRVMCEGINECAGKGTCAGTSNGCAGMNSCKGKGVVSSTFKDCVCHGGKMVDEKSSQQH